MVECSVVTKLIRFECMCICASPTVNLIRELVIIPSNRVAGRVAHANLITVVVFLAPKMVARDKMTACQATQC